MSRISIRVLTEKGVFEVTAGYDRPFNHYFGSVESEEVDEDEEPVFAYHTLYDPESDPGGGFAFVSSVKERVEKEFPAAKSIPIAFWQKVQEPLGNYNQSFGEISVH